MTAMQTETFAHPRFAARFRWQEGRLVAVEVLPPGTPATPPVSPWGERLAAAVAAFGPRPLPWPALPLARELVSAFSWAVLQHLAASVGPGQTITYSALAQRLGTSPRAVGQAMARNPWPLLFPCHRVIACQGLGGYGPGIPLKAALLELEAGR